MWRQDFATKFPYFSDAMRDFGGRRPNAMYRFSTAANVLAELSRFLLLECMEQVEPDNPKEICYELVSWTAACTFDMESECLHVKCVAQAHYPNCGIARFLRFLNVYLSTVYQLLDLFAFFLISTSRVLATEEKKCRRGNAASSASAWMIFQCSLPTPMRHDLIPFSCRVLQIEHILGPLSRGAR